MKWPMWIVIGALFVLGCGEDKASPPQSETARTISVSAPQTAFTGEGKKVYRRVNSWRICSPFGLSPGEVVARQEPMKVSEGEAPGVNVSPAGVETTEGGGGKWESGGFKWGLWDTIWSWIKKLLWVCAIGGIGLIVLLVIPATRPIGESILRFFGWLIPIVGGAIEAVRAALFKKQRDQVIAGGEEFKKAVEADSMIPEQIKGDIKQLFRDQHRAAQDADTQEAVKAQTK